MTKGGLGTGKLGTGGALGTGSGLVTKGGLDTDDLGTGKLGTGGGLGAGKGLGVNKYPYISGGEGRTRRNGTPNGRRGFNGLGLGL